MSRVGRSPIDVPSGVKVTLDDGSVAVSGPQGTLRRDLPGNITVRRSDASSSSSGPTTNAPTARCTA